MKRGRNLLLALVLCGLCPVAAQAERAANTIILDEAGVKNLRIKMAVAEEVTFEQTVFAIGRIEDIPERHSVVSTRIAGRVVKLDVFEGDAVIEGQRIAVIESRQLGNPPPTVELLAPQAGIVIESHVRLGQPVEPSQELMDIADRSRVWAVARIPEQESARMAAGTSARIRVPALGSELLAAKLDRFGVEADARSGTVDGIFELDNPDSRLRPGMRAEFSIIVQTREDVLAIPREAVQGDPARRIVFLKDFELPNAFVRSPVVLGEQNDRLVEVISGVFPGDEVVAGGSYGLSFTGPASGMSLKEALDAAHGHEHNEDGSEMTAEQKQAKQREEAAAGGEVAVSGTLDTGLLVYSGVVTLLLVWLGLRAWRPEDHA